MFFIGVFGIDQKQKQIGTYNNTICLSCGAYSRFDIIKSYSYFHIFFIPTFRWNIKYYIKTACCNEIFELDKEIGQQYEKGENPVIKPEHIKAFKHFSYYKNCPNCDNEIESQYLFCPYCGKKL